MSWTSTRNEAATIRADLQTGDGVPREAFDCIILTQTISITYDFAGALDTACAALARAACCC